MCVICRESEEEGKEGCGDEGGGGDSTEQVRCTSCFLPLLIFIFFWLLHVNIFTYVLR